MRVLLYSFLHSRSLIVTPNISIIHDIIIHFGHSFLWFFFFFLFHLKDFVPLKIVVLAYIPWTFFFLFSQCETLFTFPTKKFVINYMVEVWPFGIILDCRQNQGI